MADIALYRLDDGSFKKVDGSMGISWLRKEAAKGNLSCSGLDETCGVKVEPFQTTNAIFFRAKRGQKHKLGCECDDTDAGKIVYNLDHVGRDITPEDLFEKFSKSKPEEENESKKTNKGTKIICINYSDDDKDFEDERAIKRETRDPRNLRELCALLSKKEPDDMYAGICVGDMFVDHRNIAEIRRNGIPEGKPVVILLSQISRKKIDSLKMTVPEQAIVLGDAYAYADNDKQLICIVQGSLAARRKIFGIDDKKKKESDKRNTAKKVKKIIAIYGIWTKDPSNEGVFICEPINVGQVFCAEEKFYE